MKVTLTKFMFLAMIVGSLITINIYYNEDDVIVGHTDEILEADESFNNDSKNVERLPSQEHVESKVKIEHISKNNLEDVKRKALEVAANYQEKYDEEVEKYAPQVSMTNDQEEDNVITIRPLVTNDEDLRKVFKAHDKEIAQIEAEESTEEYIY